MAMDFVRINMQCAGTTITAPTRRAISDIHGCGFTSLEESPVEWSHSRCMDISSAALILPNLIFILATQTSPWRTWHIPLIKCPPLPPLYPPPPPRRPHPPWSPMLLSHAQRRSRPAMAPPSSVNCPAARTWPAGPVPSASAACSYTTRASAMNAPSAPLD